MISLVRYSARSETNITFNRIAQCLRHNKIRIDKHIEAKLPLLLMMSEVKSSHYKVTSFILNPSPLRYIDCLFNRIEQQFINNPFVSQFGINNKRHLSGDSLRTPLVTTTCLTNFSSCSRIKVTNVELYDCSLSLSSDGISSLRLRSIHSRPN